MKRLQGLFPILLGLAGLISEIHAKLTGLQNNIELQNYAFASVVIGISMLFFEFGKWDITQYPSGVVVKKNFILEYYYQPSGHRIFKFHQRGWRITLVTGVLFGVVGIGLSNNWIILPSGVTILLAVLMAIKWLLRPTNDGL